MGIVGALTSASSTFRLRCKRELTLDVLLTGIADVSGHSQTFDVIITPELDVIVFARAGLLVPAKRIRNTVDIVFTLGEGFVAAIRVNAIVASHGQVLVDVGDRRADGNGYEDEEPREAAYRPRPRHPRDDDGGCEPRTKRFITAAGRLIVIFGSREREERPEISRPAATDRPDRSPKVATSRSRHTAAGSPV